MRIKADLNAYSTAQLVSTFNDAVEMLGTHSPVKKFATKGAALDRINKLCTTHGLSPIVSSVAGSYPLLVKASNMESDNFETSAEELAAQQGRPSNEPAMDDATVERFRTVAGAMPTPMDATEATDAPGQAAVAGTGNSATEPTDGAVVQPTEKKARKPREPKADKPAKSTEPKAPRAPKVDRKPAAKLVACRENTNQALLVDCLAKGTTIAAATKHINETLGKSLSEQVIYSTMLYDVCTMKGYGLEGTLDGNGQPTFKLVYPAGVTAPLPHTAKKSPAAKAAKAA